VFCIVEKRWEKQVDFNAWQAEATFS